MQNPKNELKKTAYLDNDFIRKSTALQPLNELEINLLIYMCYKAKENVDLESGEGWTSLVNIDMKKFYDGIGYSKPWYQYTDDEKMVVYQRLKQMQEKTFEIRTEEHKETNSKGEKTLVFESYSYFSHIKYHFDTGILDVRMPQETQQFLMNYETGFTPVEFGNIIKLKSKHAKMLYLYFRSFKNGVDASSYTIEHLKQLLGLDGKYKRWVDLKKYVLLPAIKEINSKTDIFVFGNKKKFYDALGDRKIENVQDDELARIVVDSMACVGDRGKAINKIMFRTVEKETAEKEQKLDFTGLLPNVKNAGIMKLE